MAIVPFTRRQRGSANITPFRDDFDEFVRRFFEPREMARWGLEKWPVMDISENDQEFIVKAEVPGCKAEDIDISIHGNILTVTGEKKQEKEENEEGLYHVERSYGTFRRDVSLASDVDPSKVEAKCKDGLLNIKLPKTETSKSSKIKVKAE